MEIEKFARSIAPAIYETAKAKGFPEYICGVVIAQAYYESDGNTTELSKKYFNFFNLKASSSWKGKMVAQDKSGKFVEVKKANRNTFKAFANAKEGIEGFFDLLSTPRYQNTKKATSGKDYLEKLEGFGYSLESYKDVYKIYKDNKLDDFNYKDTKKKITPVAPKPAYRVPKTAKAPAEKAAKPISAKKKALEPKYLPAYTGNNNSIIGALLDVGCPDTSKEFRVKLAKINNIPITPDFNIKLLNLLRQGKLRIN